VTSPLRAVVRDIFVYGTGDLLVRATAFITLPIYTRILSPNDYGVWAFATAAASLVSAFLILGGDSAYARYYFEARTLEERRTLTSTWLAFLTLWSLVVVIPLVPWSGLLSRSALDSPDRETILALILMTAPVTLANTMLGQALRNEFRPRLFVALNVATAILTVGLSIIFAAAAGWGVTGLAAGGLLAGVLMLPPRLWTVHHLLRPVFSRRLLGKLLRFGVPLVPATVAWWVFGLSDRIVLGKLSTLDQVGLYSVANSATSVLALLVGALGQAWSPHAVKLFEEQPELTPRLFGRMLTYILVGFGVISVGITTFAHELLSVLASREFVGASRAVGPLALAFVAYASIQVTATGISLRKKTGYLAIFAWGAALLNLGLNLAFAGAYGMMAAAWATLVSYVFLTLGYFVVSQRLWPVSVERRKALLAILITGAFTVAVPVLPDLPLAPALAMKLAYVTACLALLIILGVVERHELVAFVTPLRRLRPSRATRWPSRVTRWR
jgi:O-antigen/teichoic acid export membrane protein